MPDPPASSLDCSASTQVRVQIFRADGTHEPRYYSLADLSNRWPPGPRTIESWVRKMKKAGRGPTNGQVIKYGPHQSRRRLYIREDYAALVRAIYLEKTVKM